MVECQPAPVFDGRVGGGARSGGIVRGVRSGDHGGSGGDTVVVMTVMAVVTKVVAVIICTEGAEWCWHTVGERRYYKKRNDRVPIPVIPSSPWTSSTSRRGRGKESREVEQPRSRMTVDADALMMLADLAAQPPPRPAAVCCRVVWAVSAHNSANDRWQCRGAHETTTNRKPVF